VNRIKELDKIVPLLGTARYPLHESADSVSEESIQSEIESLGSTGPARGPPVVSPEQADKKKRKGEKSLIERGCDPLNTWLGSSNTEMDRDDSPDNVSDTADPI
jgi:hypothetical protein